MKITSFRDEYGWLSNFHTCRMKFNLYGLQYDIPRCSVEHVYQALKCRYSQEDFEKILYSSKPKQEGRKVRLDENFELKKVEYMEKLLYIKFNKDLNPELYRKLLSTENIIIEEHNYWNDTFWGICKGKGENMLGHLLMDIREKLKLNKD